jgi:hypothetical protein
MMMKKIARGGELLCVLINDDSRFVMQNLKYDALLCKPEHKNKWFFYELDQYIDKIGGFLEMKHFKKVLLFGNSKSGTAAAVISNRLAKKFKGSEFYCWALCPVVEVKWGERLVDAKTGANLSSHWDSMMTDSSIRDSIERWGRVAPLLDGSFKMMYSYTFDDHWDWDRRSFETVRGRPGLIEDCVTCTEEIRMHDPSKKAYENMHNLLAWHWRIRRNLMYDKIANLTNCRPPRSSNPR